MDITSGTTPKQAPMKILTLVGDSSLGLHSQDRLPSGHLEREIRVAVTLQRKVRALGEAPLLLSEVMPKLHSHEPNG